MKTIVFVHGYLGGGSQWAEQKAAFGNRFQVITPDLPGYGGDNQSITPESIRGLAMNVFQQLDILGVHRFHLVGHSMGGMIVQEMVALAPERIEKLVLYGTGPLGLMPGRFETIDESRRAVSEQGVEPTGRRIAATWFMQGESGRGYDVCADLAVKATEQAALAGLTAMEDWSGAEALAVIKSPTLVLWGDGDRAYLWPQPEQLWNSIENALLAVIPGCAHAVHLEKPHLFNATLEDFLLGN
jgi:pimeloyl-ACP methyl ester carboxylesterase